MESRSRTCSCSSLALITDDVEGRGRGYAPPFQNPSLHLPTTGTGRISPYQATRSFERGQVLLDTRPSDVVLTRDAHSQAGLTRGKKRKYKYFTNYPVQVNIRGTTRIHEDPQTPLTNPSGLRSLKCVAPILPYPSPLALVPLVTLLPHVIVSPIIATRASSLLLCHTLATSAIGHVLGHRRRHQVVSEHTTTLTLTTSMTTTAARQI